MSHSQHRWYHYRHKQNQCNSSRPQPNTHSHKDYSACPQKTKTIHMKLQRYTFLLYFNQREDWRRYPHIPMLCYSSSWEMCICLCTSWYHCQRSSVKLKLFGRMPEEHTCLLLSYRSNRLNS